jgi:DNA-binding NarL/FixJ family response regulator
VGSGEQAVAVSLAARPDVVLMDVSMPDMDGIEATRRLLEVRPEARVVMLTSFADHERVMEALDSGAIGYLLKDAESDELLRGVRAAARGESPLSPRAARALITERRGQRPFQELTSRELDVLRLVARGLSNKQIAWRLAISEKTVKAHMTSIFGRIGVADRTQAALWAQRHGV